MLVPGRNPIAAPAQAGGGQGGGGVHAGGRSMSLGTVTPTATVTVLPQISGYLTGGGFYRGPERSRAGEIFGADRPAGLPDSTGTISGAFAKDSARWAGAARPARLRNAGGARFDFGANGHGPEISALQDAATVQEDQANIDTAKLDLCIAIHLACGRARRAAAGRISAIMSLGRPPGFCGVDDDFLPLRWIFFWWRRTDLAAGSGAGSGRRADAGREPPYGQRMMWRS